ncbi:Hypothetical_protein [Hexamita inflata]|uniref:Hypothetical_protein n=1 Tax=Hexamita inflata TaxID=28002 RepID=A0AA86NX39_9EUKA|nr:Hypothetical protein HINF_LOCUS14901 [Hexamita inflata]
MFTILLIAGVVFTIIPYTYEYKVYYSTEEVRFSWYYSTDRIPINLGCGISLDILGFFGFIISCVLYHINKKTPEDYKDYANLSYQKKYQSVFILLYIMFFAFMVAGVALCTLSFRYYYFSYYMTEQQQKYYINHDSQTKSVQLHIGPGVFQLVAGLFGLLILQKFQLCLNTPVSKQVQRSEQILTANIKAEEQNNKSYLPTSKLQKKKMNQQQEPESIRLYENQYYERHGSNVFDSIEIIDNLNVTQIGTSQVE